MSQIKAKQLTKLFSGYVRVNAFTASGSSIVVTTPVTTALSTAGEGSVAVPLQVATSSSIGVITSSPVNRVEIFSNATKQKLISVAKDEVYGRLTESSNVYTLSFYTNISGTETAYTLSSTSIDFEFAYRFDFYRVPSDFAISTNARNVSDDPIGTGQATVSELLTVTALNTLSALTNTPLGAVTLLVNGLAEVSVGSPTPFTVSGTAITWNATNATYSLETTDQVIAIYQI